MTLIFQTDTKSVYVDKDRHEIHVECEDRGAGVYEYKADDRESFASAMRDAMNELMSD